MSAQSDRPKKGKGQAKGAASVKNAARRKLLRAAVVAAPALAAGGFLAGLGARSALARGDGGLALSPEETSALRERFLDRARSTTAAPLRTADLPVGGAGLGTLPGQVGSATGAAAATVPRAADRPRSESALVRMQADLERVMLKPRSERKWIMMIDLRKCIGCSACTIACKMENLLPPGVVYRPVMEQEEGRYPNVTRHWLPRPCMQCDDPPCTPVCPVGATWKRDDGIVVVDYKICIGCRYCIAACPYGARYSDFGEHYTDGTPGGRQPYEEAPSPEYGKRWRPNGGSPVGNVRKCQFCIHRLDAGMLPACVTTCIGGATYFGDQNDPDSLVNELLARGSSSGRPMQLKPEQGTDPKVYYLT